MDTSQRKGITSIEYKISIAGGIETVGGYAFKTKLLADHFSVDRKAGTCHRAGTEREYIVSLVDFLESLTIAVEFFAVSQHIVCTKHRLRPLEMGVCGENEIRGLLRLHQKRGLKQTQLMIHFFNGLADPHPEVSRDLIIPAPSGVQFAAHISKFLDEPVFHRHMDIFVFGNKLKLTLLNFVANSLQTLLNLLAVLRGDETTFG